MDCFQFLLILVSPSKITNIAAFNYSLPLKIRAMMTKLRKFSNLVFLLFMLVSCLEDDTIDLLDDRDAFLGAWNVSESCSKDAYSVQIEKDPSNSAQVLIRNFWNTGNCGNSVYGIVAGSGIYIPTQNFCNGDFKADGSGEMVKEKITWSYTVNDGADLFTCVATYSRP